MGSFAIIQARELWRGQTLQFYTDSAIDAVLNQLRKEGYPVKNEDVSRLSSLIYDHINILGCYSFAIPESVIKGELRPFRDPIGEIP